MTPVDDPARLPIAPAAADPRHPLVVDLDGSLVHTDTTLEALLALSRHPVKLGRVLLTLPQGRAVLKQRLAATVTLDVASLPYNRPLLEYLREQRDAGRHLILATGTDRAIADAVARHLGLFDAVLASDGKTNLTGTAKLRAIGEALGGVPFTYVGNSAKDLRVWCDAAGAICVNARPAVVRAARELTQVERSFPAEDPWPLLLRAMRPRRWAKNLLVFVPLVAAPASGDTAGRLAAMGVFIAFCCAASGMYLLNDLADLASDRADRRKATRPFASGALPLHIGLIAAAVLLVAGCGMSIAVHALPIVLGYVALSGIYSLWLKSWPRLGVLAFAGLYGLRVIGGSAASGYPVSLWLLALLGLLFFGLAAAERARN